MNDAKQVERCEADDPACIGELWSVETEAAAHERRATEAVINTVIETRNECRTHTVKNWIKFKMKYDQPYTLEHSVEVDLYFIPKDR